MIAVVEIGGNQHIVQVGDVIEVDNQNVEEGATIETEALLVSQKDGSKAKIGEPTVAGSKVTFKVLKHDRGEKIRVFKMKAKKHYARTHGFKSELSILETVSIA